MFSFAVVCGGTRETKPKIVLGSVFRSGTVRWRSSKDFEQYGIIIKET